MPRLCSTLNLIVNSCFVCKNGKGYLKFLTDSNMLKQAKWQNLIQLFWTEWIQYIVMWPLFKENIWIALGLNKGSWPGREYLYIYIPNNNIKSQNFILCFLSTSLITRTVNSLFSPGFFIWPVFMTLDSNSYRIVLSISHT